MEHFGKAQTVRLRSHHNTYLSVPDDDGGGDSSASAVKQLKNGASRAARWQVEPVPAHPDFIRLRSSDGRYLSASDKRFILGATGRKVLLIPRPDPTTEWKPLREGTRVKLLSRHDTFLRGNGGVLPYKGSVTHDVPKRTITQESVLWDVDVLQVRPSPLQPQQLRHSLESEPEPLVESGWQSESGLDSESASWRDSVSGSESESGTPVASPVRTLKHGLSRCPSMGVEAQGMTIQYYLLDAAGEVDESSEGSFLFQGSSVEDLTSKVEEITGMEDVILCIHDVINDRFLRLRLNLPPNRRAMTVVVVPASSAVAKALDT